MYTLPTAIKNSLKPKLWPHTNLEYQKNIDFTVWSVVGAMALFVLESTKPSGNP